MLKKKTTSAAHRSNQQHPVLQQVKKAHLKGDSLKPYRSKDDSLFINDLRSEFPPDVFAMWLLDEFTPSWMPKRLQVQMQNALNGLSKRMALEVADDLLDCWTYGVRHYTCVEHIDKMLHSLYNKILYAAAKKGISLPNHF